LQRINDDVASSNVVDMEYRRSVWLGSLLILALAGGVYAQSSGSGDTCERGTSATLVSCHDGDTCDFKQFDAAVRLADIDTPETDGNCQNKASSAREELLDLLTSADTICVVREEKGYYDRWIAQLYADGTDVNDWMIEHTSAVEYGHSTCSTSTTNDSSDDQDDADEQSGATARSPSCQHGDVDCSELNSCERARHFLHKCDGDPFNLDGDGNGVPCESMCSSG
jgi:endonuclease YncB( thermonuclease family)